MRLFTPLLILVHALAMEQLPNIVILLTDDQDLVLGGASHMPILRRELAGRGMTFDYAFANTPVCCPSRSSLLTGRYTHNHGALNNTVAGGCSSTEWQQNEEIDTLAVRLQATGYSTLYAGKYLNLYGYKQVGGVEHVPPGWTEFFGLVGNSKYYNYTISDNGKGVHFKNNYKTDYLTDVLARRSVRFIQEQVAVGNPFLLWVGVPAAHAGFTPAPQYLDTALDLHAPRTFGSFNTVYQDKHEQMRNLKPLTDRQIAQTDEIFRKRLGTLKSVDDLIAKVINALGPALDNTYIVFTSDHGFHLGQFAMGFDKRQLYETDVRVPFIIRGPGIRPGTVSHQIISHVDLAPTLHDLVTGFIPIRWDGMSYKNALFEKPMDPPKQQVLLQYFGENSPICGAFNMSYNANNESFFHNAYIPAPCDSWNNTYSCIRTVSETQNDVYCKFKCFDKGHNLVPCEIGTPEAVGEYYNLLVDPHQTKNSIHELSETQKFKFDRLLSKLETCIGQLDCM